MDKRSKDILFRTYWTANGWRDRKDRTIDPEDFRYAKEHGLMFDPITIDHDVCVERVIALAAAISPSEVARAFLSSLSTRRLDWRSGIASWAVGRLFTPHTFVPGCPGYFYENGVPVELPANHCALCGQVKRGVIGMRQYTDEDLNVLNFERIKWGGVRHGELLYTLFDLEQFRREVIPEPTEADAAILRGMLEAIRACQPGDHPSALRDRFAEVPGLKSNKNERFALLEILACIGVLPPGDSRRAIRGKTDWNFVEYWRGEDGYDEDVVVRYFGKYLA